MPNVFVICFGVKLLFLVPKNEDNIGAGLFFDCPLFFSSSKELELEY